MNFSDLRKMRRAAKLSQSELGERVGCSQPTIHRIENGDGEPQGALRITVSKWLEEARELHSDDQPKANAHD